MQLGSPNIHNDIARQRNADLLEEARRDHLAASAAGHDQRSGLLTALKALVSRLRREPPVVSEEAPGAEAEVV